ncbi:MAG: sialate O-acetylesterase, partial [Lachnospiraceae bacterium]
KEFFLQEAAGATARAYLGAIVDADKVYINGHLIGETGYKYPPRKYDFPAEYLKKGCNHIRIEMFVFREVGGFIPGKPYYVRCGEETAELSGVWNYRIVRTMPVLPDMTFFQYKATGLYNGMLAPLAGHTFRGMAFYQGESNTDRPENYGKYFDRAIEDWRTLLKNTVLPVAYVQLAGFADSQVPCTGTNWAVLREEQRQSLKKPKTAMVVAADIGEYNDLHPQNKLVLGERLALAMEKLCFGEDVVYSGPLYAGMQTEGERCRILFTHTGSGLTAKGTEGEVYGIELAGADGIFYKAHARIENNTVLAACEEVKVPYSCRYAWNDNPTEANLYNAEGLPASCFRS